MIPGELITECRKREGLTQRKLAALLWLAPQTVSHLEHYDSISITSLRRALDVMGYDLILQAVKR